MIKSEFIGFERLFKRFLEDEKAEVKWPSIEPLPKSAIVPYTEIAKDPATRERIRENLNKLIVIKLNGGLGTTMGCQGPKSTITVRDDLTFLDLIIRQLEVNI